MKRTLVLTLTLTGCASNPCYPMKWGFAAAHNLQYPTNPTETTPLGTPVDDSGQDVSGATIDRLTNEVAACLKVSVDPKSFVVKIPADWSLSCDGSNQVLTAIAPGTGCEAKGMTPDQQCPCRWRVLIQCPNVIVATPSLYLFKDALVRWVTGSRNPWADPELAKCATPTTGPLSLGGG